MADKVVERIDYPFAGHWDQRAHKPGVAYAVVYQHFDDSVETAIFDRGGKELDRFAGDFRQTGTTRQTATERHAAVEAGRAAESKPLLEPGKPAPAGQVHAPGTGPLAPQKPKP